MFCIYKIFNIQLSFSIWDREKDREGGGEREKERLSDRESARGRENGESGERHRKESKR